jgi:hypothetical protein
MNDSMKEGLLLLFLVIEICGFLLEQLVDAQDLLCKNRGK